MKIGTHLPTYWADYGNADEWTAVEEAAKPAEAFGFDSVWANEEAQRLAHSETMLRTFDELWLPLVRTLGMTALFKHNQSIPNEAVDAEYYIQHHWFVGSVETVVDRVVALDRLSGGFGALLISAFDCCDNPEPWNGSLRLLAQEVLPRVNARLETIR